MSKQANPTMIGAFVLGAIALFTTVLIVFAGGSFFRGTRTGVAYFDGSVRGLQVGSAVVFRGVPIGKVTDIKVVVDTEELELSIPVFMEIDLSMLDFTGGDAGDDERSYERIQTLIGRGLRAQLVVDSLVTGQVLVEFAFHPGAPESYRYPGRGEIFEIPTIPSDLQVVMDKVGGLIATVGEMPVDELIEKAVSSVDALQRLLNSPELESIVSGVDQIVNAEETQQLTANLQATLERVNATLDDVRLLVQHADAKVDPLMESVTHTVQGVNETLAVATGLLTEVRDLTSGDSELYHSTNATLQELEAAMRALRTFLDYLDRHPEALLKGKKSP